MSTAYERLRAALESRGIARETGAGKLIARCPAHDDRNPSLSVTGIEGSALLYCHAGCATAEVLAALDMGAADLFDNRREATYVYPGGRKVHRKADKQFPQSGNKDDRSLYRADRLGDADHVLVVEGEKDVLAAESIGAVAVCSAMGAGKAHLADWNPLRGRHITVVADNDGPGRKHAEKVAELVTAAGAVSVRIVCAAVGKDLADHVAASKSLEELVDQKAAAPAAGEFPLPPEPVAEGDAQGGDGGRQPRRSVAAQLVDLTLAEYTLGVSETDEPFAVSKTRPHIALPLRGGKTGYRPELARRYYDLTDSVPGSQALTDACAVLEGKAAQSDPRPLALRVAEAGGAVYLDTGTPEARVIRIAGGRWDVLDTAPVLFRRTKLTGPMDVPAPGGDLGQLWTFAAITAADRPIVAAVLVHALVAPDTPHPILALLAEQGATKSSTTRMLVDLIDPSPVPLRQAPRDPESWSTAASASWVVALDNLSDIPGWLSDSLCRAATGDGNVKRALYTDADVAVTQFRRCVFLNGIDLGALRGDLAERMAVADLDRIAPAARRTEAELAADWARARPGVLGALLDLAARVHHRLAGTVVDCPPRMADFARVLAAVDAELGTAGLSRYRDRAGRMAADSLTAEEFIGRLLAGRYRCEDTTASRMLADLTPEAKEWRKPKDWPRNPRAVTTLLRRHAPALRHLGWAVSDDGGQNKNGVTLWTLTPPPVDQGRESDPPDPPNPSAQVNGHILGGSRTGPDNPPTPPGGSGGQQAGHADCGNPPQTAALNCDDGPAGQAGQKNASAPLTSPEPCPVCGYPPPPGYAMHHDCARKAAATPPEGLIA